MSAERRFRFSVRLSDSVRKRLKREAHRRDVPMNALIEKAVEQWLNRNEGKAV